MIVNGGTTRTTQKDARTNIVLCGLNRTGIAVTERGQTNER